MKKRSDFERILMNIAIDTAGTCFDRMVRLDNGWDIKIRFNNPVAQFIPLEMAESINLPLQQGDIVRCKTNPNHHWGISTFIEKLAYSDWLLQEIGGNARLNMYNEDVDVLRFMDPRRLYSGVQYKIYQWASIKAFSSQYNKDADYLKRCGGVEFNSNMLTIWCRTHIFAMERNENGTTLYAQPKKCTMEWGKTTRLKDIIATMHEQGFNDEFEYTQEKPIEGQGGYTSFTKHDITKILGEVR